MNATAFFSVGPGVDAGRALAVIVGAGVLTYALRAGGYLLAGKIPRRGRVAAALEALPTALLVSLIAPELLAFGWLGLGLAAVVVGSTRVIGRSLPAAALGVLAVVGVRALLGG